ncbi:RsmE family RNA methyltransferase [Spirochaeta cellobiosiphila]|uniref:RsmE family RNA methyltransferase n=1 Tax=Spirochaeta cellobiosiphila TaxID=504483 RepID=UPI0003FE5125|nr:RsmE family RNA methyltransferase [Spirochaeta cellobiosiphila]
MNIILLEQEETRGFFLRNTKIYIHITKILKSKPGDSLEAGVVNGSLGQLQILSIDADRIEYEYYSRTNQGPRPYPIHMIIGTPRPPVAKRLIKDLTTWSIEKVSFVNTQLGEKSYLNSNLWIKEEYKESLWEGASQGRTTRLLEVERMTYLSQALKQYDNSEWTKILLHNGNDLPPFEPLSDKQSKVLLAIGPERGWTEEERKLFAESGFQAFQLGRAVLRTEVACHAAITAVLQQNNWYL